MTLVVNPTLFRIIKDRFGDTEGFVESKPLPTDIQKIADETCMTPQEAEDAKKQLDAYCETHPEDARRLAARVAADDAWNFPEKRG